MGKQSWNTMWRTIKKWERTGGWVRPVAKWLGRVDRVCSSWLCERFHRKDHVCWDDLWDVPYDGHTEGYIPGNECWYCNRCGRPWSVPNPRTSPLDLWEKKESWAEYAYPERVLTIYGREPEFICRALKKGREERDAESEATSGGTSTV